ncbi:MAG TPA: hypothetical protein ENJ52_00355 [Aliiroseovarius sp.]|nr:hypothetical protein [Aliiroseovarius sp.]
MAGFAFPGQADFFFAFLDGGFHPAAIAFHVGPHGFVLRFCCVDPCMAADSGRVWAGGDNSLKKARLLPVKCGDAIFLVLQAIGRRGVDCFRQI